MDYKYRCVDISGKEVRGALPALDIGDAKSRLKAMGLIAIELAERKDLFVREYGGRKRITDTDLYHLSKELSVLLSARITIDKAMETLIASVSNGAVKATMQYVLGEMKGGKRLSQAFEETRRFNPLVNVMIRVGEDVGDLRSAFENIAEYMHFKIQFKNEIRNATTYPLFLVVASMVTLLVIVKLILPRFFSIFGPDKASLPFVTKALYSISQSINLTNLLILLVLMGLIGLGLRRINLREMFQKVYSYLIFIPFLKNMIIYLELSRFSYAMYYMLKGGVEFIHALRLSTGLIQNTPIRVAVERTLPPIKEGKSIAEVFSYISFLPPMMPGMLRAGEASGNLKEIFFELYRVFNERFTNSMKRLGVLLEPVIITITGIVIGIIVISLMLTVMSASNIRL
ncbi:MAG: type II secretion system F family protein [Nitrospirota bacterium]